MRYLAVKLAVAATKTKGGGAQDLGTNGLEKKKGGNNRGQPCHQFKATGKCSADKCSYKHNGVFENGGPSATVDSPIKKKKKKKKKKDE